MHRVEAGHDHAPLALPDLAVGAEHTGRQTHLGPDLLEPGAAAKPLRPVAQDRCHLLMIGHDDDAPIAEPQPVQLAELTRPIGKLMVGALLVELQRIAEDRNAARAGQVLEAADPG